MTICKFFANGNCRLGNQCRFEHINPRQPNRNQYSKSYNQQPPVYQNQNYQGSRQNQHTSSQQQPQRSQQTLFSFTNSASSVKHANATGSTFSFNRTAEQLTSNRQPGQPQPHQQKTFSFGNATSNSTGGAKVFGNTTSSIFGGSNAASSSAKTFSFSQALKQVQSKPQQFEGNANDATINSSTRVLGSASIFGGSTKINPMPSFFGGSQTTTVSSALDNRSILSQSKFFPTQQPQASFFGNIQPQQKLSSTSTFGNKIQGQSIFSGVSNQATGLSGPSEIYRPLEKLDDEEKKLFQQAEFSNHIPLKPPPIELCF